MIGGVNFSGEIVNECAAVGVAWGARAGRLLPRAHPPHMYFGRGLNIIGRLVYNLSCGESSKQYPCPMATTASPLLFILIVMETKNKQGYAGRGERIGGEIFPENSTLNDRDAGGDGKSATTHPDFGPRRRRVGRHSVNRDVTELAIDLVAEQTTGRGWREGECRRLWKDEKKGIIYPMKGNEPPELSLTGRNSTAEAANSHPYSTRMGISQQPVEPAHLLILHSVTCWIEMQFRYQNINRKNAYLEPGCSSASGGWRGNGDRYSSDNLGSSSF
ncbi:hypothetical protein EVAR_733_1 [Eumeta japonica]|uniref:Uncharacterized protein n=1 Tax=Eumeta variegata TaxID=151549 RepID=A0A4C1SBW7_EUMVA|nr:hypothetical protein EVAR_733_1 [Eumeta japonica]